MVAEDNLKKYQVNLENKSKCLLLPKNLTTNQWKNVLQEIDHFINFWIDPVIEEINEIRKRNIWSLDVGEFEKGKEIPLAYYDFCGYDWNKNASWKEDKEKYERLNIETLNKIKDLRNKVIYENGEPLAGLNLNGVSEDLLRNLPNKGNIKDLGEKLVYKEDKFFSSFIKYKNWIKIDNYPDAADGNCLLHSFATFLTGKKSHHDLTIRIRIAMILELINNFENNYYCNLNSKSVAHVFKIELFDGKIAKDYEWLSNSQIKLLSYVFKRNLVIISKNKNEYEPACSYPDINEYPEEWVIYNSGVHFQPLIKNY